MKNILLILSVIFFTSSGVTENSVHIDNTEEYPKAFEISQNSDAFEALSEEYSTSLLNVCKNDMDKAYDHWVNLSLAMEKYAEKKGFEIKGVKVWITVFWAEDGSINHIGYALKPRSRNVRTSVMTAFFKLFIRKHKPSLTSDKKFSHYGVMSFPVYARPAIPK